MREQDVFWFEITVDDLLGFQQEKTAEKLLGKAANDFYRETTECVRLDELVEVHVQQFCGDTEMSAEVEALSEVDHAVLVLRIL